MRAGAVASHRYPRRTPGPGNPACPHLMPGSSREVPYARHVDDPRDAAGQTRPQTPDVARRFRGLITDWGGVFLTEQEARNYLEETYGDDEQEVEGPDHIRTWEDGDFRLEMFDTGHYEDISLAEWMAHTPHQLIDQHLHVGAAMIDAIPKGEAVITPL